MNSFLISILSDEIEHAKFLKTKIIFPLKFPELTGLANRCITNFNDQIMLLEDIQKNSDNYSENSIWRWIRIAHRKIEMTEKWGMPSLYYQTEDIGFLNKLVFQVCNEVNLPLEHPSVACLSTDYYYTPDFIDVIFVPLSESGFLLHLPDLYHEIGHYVLKNKKEEKLSNELESYIESLDVVVEYFVNLSLKLQRERGPESTILKIQNFFENWKQNWIEEFFCDLFATFLLGPAYGWAHFYLIIKRNPNIFKIDPLSNQDHPPDDARMKMILYALQLLGYEKEVQNISNNWNQLRKEWGTPNNDFQFAFPDTLLNSITEIFFNGFKKSSLNLFLKDQFDLESSTIRKLLNLGWTNFWSLTPSDFRQWEIKSISDLKKNFA